MLEIIVPAIEKWDERKEEFVYTKTQKLQLEHSLVSIQKWEAKWNKPFLSKEGRTVEEMLDYIRCMTITQNVNPDVYRCLSEENIEAINDYIGQDMTATWFSNTDKKKPNRRVITAELIYYWMIALGIPQEYKKWHLNQLITLIRVTEAEQQPKKKLNQNAEAARRRALNKERRERLNSKG